MAFIQKHDRIFGQVVGQSGWRFTRRRTTQVSGVVFNSFAMPEFAEHFKIKSRALLKPLGFDELAHAHQLFDALVQLQLDGFHGCKHLLSGRDIVA